MTLVYPSSVGVGSRRGPSGFFLVGAVPFGRRDDGDDEEGDLLPKLPLLYTNIKLVTMVTKMMPLTPWHWRDTRKALSC